MKNRTLRVSEESISVSKLQQLAINVSASASRSGLALRNFPVFQFSPHIRSSPTGTTPVFRTSVLAKRVLHSIPVFGN